MDLSLLLFGPLPLKLHYFQLRGGLFKTFMAKKESQPSKSIKGAFSVEKKIAKEGS